MDINMYAIYAKNANVKEENFEKVLAFIEKFEKISSSNVAKELLREDLGIKDSVKNYPLGANSFLSVDDSQSFLHIKLEYDKYVYNYGYRK